MSNAALVPTEHTIDDKSLFALVTDGDASKLSDAQKLAYYKARCEAAGLDPRAQPFQFLRLNGKLVLYALKSCTDQLAAKHGIRCEILSQTSEEGIRVVTVRATAADGRQTDEIGAVSIKGLSGEQLCNAYMKCATKAKRRATLAICGLGMLDESELDTVPGARPEAAAVVQMPRRKSEAEAAPADEVVIVAEEIPPGDPISQAEPEDDIEELLQASIDAQQAQPDEPITQAQVARMMAMARDSGGHNEASVKAWLKAQGFASRKAISQTQYGAICDRLANPTPLEA